MSEDEFYMSNEEEPATPYICGLTCAIMLSITVIILLACIISGREMTVHTMALAMLPVALPGIIIGSVFIGTLMVSAVCELYFIIRHMLKKNNDK